MENMVTPNMDASSGNSPARLETILITGNMGYVGPGVIDALRRSNPQARIIGLDTGYFAHCLTQAPALPETRLDRQMFMDLRQVGPEVFQGVDGVVHLAGISNDPMGNRFSEPTTAINDSASVALARMAKNAGVRSFVFASS
ncbi:MAG: NAD-dependent epimerase/dehydratase family protein, partial [Desulfovibrio sp.]